MTDDDAAPPEQGVFANRTLNLRSVRAIGYDMDYTLIHYRVDEWERAAFEHARSDPGRRRGWPVDDLDLRSRRRSRIGLVFDLELGNLVKATRFGYVVRAQHGNRRPDLRRAAATPTPETVVELAETAFEFMNTLFELSRASLLRQLVDTARRDAAPRDPQLRRPVPGRRRRPRREPTSRAR